MSNDSPSSSHITSWDLIVHELRNRAQLMHEAREAALIQCRKIVQLSARSIRHVHRRQFSSAEELLAQAIQASEAARLILEPFPELNQAYLHDSEKEMVEAAGSHSTMRMR
jgi:translin